MTTIRSNSQPLVSVIITTFFRNDYLESCLESVISQSYDNIEVIVVDDSGEQFAKPVADNYECTYIGLESNQGPSGARNRGFELARGEFIQFVDDDDRLAPFKIEKQIEVFANHPEVVVVYCGREMESGVKEYPDAELRGDALSTILTFDNNPCVTSTMLIDSDCLTHIYPFPDFEGASDTPIKIELARRGDYEFVDEILVFAGEHDANLGSTWKNIEAKWQILEEYEHLYNQYPPSVKRGAISSIYRTTGRRYLDEHLWSARAILVFGKSLYHNPEPRLYDVGEFLVSFGGRPLRKFISATISMD